MRHAPRRFLPGLLLLGAFVPGVARADAIDGHWCSEGGLRMTIQGPALVSPGGVRMAGAAAAGWICG